MNGGAVELLDLRRNKLVNRASQLARSYLELPPCNSTAQPCKPTNTGINSILKSALGANYSLLVGTRSPPLSPTTTSSVTSARSPPSHKMQ